MKLDEMKVQYERSRDGFTKESAFSVQTEQKTPKIDISGIAVKIGLCAGVLILAFIVRAFGYGSTKDRAVEANASNDRNNTSQQDQTDREQIGGLQYVENGKSSKWTAPVMTNDIELLRDGQLLRFTAVNETVCACMPGKVLSVEEDTVYGKTIRIQSESDWETIYYGFEATSVREGDVIQANEPIGTVKVGRSIYLKVLENGEPQDPSGYVDLSLGRE